MRRSRFILELGIIAVALMIVLVGLGVIANPPRSAAEQTLFPDSPTAPSVLASSFSPTAESLMNRPLPTPDYMTFSPFPGKIGPAEKICLEIYPSEIWEPGDSADVLDNHIDANMTLWLDRQQMSRQFREPFFRIGILIDKYDGNGKFAGSHGGPIYGCYSVNLAVGLHIASFEIVSTSGVRYLYTWAFHVTSTDPHEHAKMADTTSQSQTASASAYYATQTAMAKLPGATQTAIHLVEDAIRALTYTARNATEVAGKAGYLGTIAARTSTAQGTPNQSSGRNTR
jgi:hypothetical protein